MIIDCISDLHGFYPKLSGGDLLLIAGDLTAKDTPEDRLEFTCWLHKQHYRKIIYIAGNHDYSLSSSPYVEHHLDSHDGGARAEYLCDSGTEFEGLKIWGSPWTLEFVGENPKCKAFTCKTEEELEEKWEMIPHDVDILVTHMPPYGIFDGIHQGRECDVVHVGSVGLRNHILDWNMYPNLKLHVFGHIHEFGGKSVHLMKLALVNASYVNEKYQPTNKPVKIGL